VKPTSDAFLEHASDALGDRERLARRKLLGRLMPMNRRAAVSQYGDYDGLRANFKRIREHTRDNLDFYLTQFEEQALANGNQVHFARDGDEMNSIVLSLCRQYHARRVAKGKSMVTEETGLNAHLQRGGLQVTETDLGEYIIQQAGETPSHIVGPALHKSLGEITALFRARHALGSRDLESASDVVSEARGILREHFLRADVGIIGANALIAENGYSMLVTNEGNGDLCANLPPVLIVCTTLERILPRMEDAAALQRLLVRSATGQSQTCYTSFYSGPRRSDEDEGPTATHIVLLDNRRSDLLAGPYREMLDCVRCGACLNHCPIYIGVGGHAYGWVYPGPMGSVLTPLLTSLEQASALPNACTSCGRCAEVCPASIPLPDLLRELREEEAQRGITAPRWRLGLRLHAWLACHPRLYRALTRPAIRLLGLLGRRRGVFRQLPLAGGWTGQRDFPAPQGDTFMGQYLAQQRRQQRRREHG
jgi:L-lactate dehydrogenase complex protein LldF